MDFPFTPSELENGLNYLQLPGNPVFSQFPLLFLLVDKPASMLARRNNDYLINQKLSSL